MKKTILFMAIVFIMSSNSLAASCGNNNAEGNEECDGSDLRGYTCNSICTFSKEHPADYNPSYQLGGGSYNCGPGTVSCSSNCKFITTCNPVICGDGNIDANEECDSGDQNSDTAPNTCRSGCVLPKCGDDVIDSGEECDDGDACNNIGYAMNSDFMPNSCRTDCKRAYCGDGIVDSGEECDDGNTNADDGCNECKMCVTPKDNMKITKDTKFCAGTYKLSDSGEEGVIIVEGAGIIIDCDGTKIIGPGSELAQTQVKAEKVLITNENKQNSTTIINKTAPITTKALQTSTTEKLQNNTSPTIKTITPEKTETAVPIINTTKTITPLVIPKETVIVNNTVPKITTNISKTQIYTKNITTPLRNTLTLASGTGFFIKGDGVLIRGCAISGFKNGFNLEGKNNLLINNKACSNTYDIKSNGENQGSENACDSSSNWDENGANCKNQCDKTQNNNKADTPGSQDEITNSSQKEENGFFQKIFGIFG